MLVIFDLDNTLIDRDDAFLHCLKELFQRRGCLLTQIDIECIQDQDHSGRNDRAFFCNFLASQYPGLSLNSEEIWTEFQCLPDYVTKNNAVCSLLSKLSRRYALCLLSNGSSSMQRRKLANAGLEPFFDRIFISGELGISKPNIKVFEHVMSTYGVEASQCIMIGDDQLRDIDPARQAGMHSVWFDPQNTGDLSVSVDPRFETYHHIITTLNQVEKAIIACSI